MTAKLTWEAAVEEMARCLCSRHYQSRFHKPGDDPHVLENVAANSYLFEKDARAVFATISQHIPIREILTGEMVVLPEKLAVSLCSELQNFPHRLARPSPYAGSEAQITAHVNEQLRAIIFPK